MRLIERVSSKVEAREQILFHLVTMDVALLEFVRRLVGESPTRVFAMSVSIFAPRMASAMALTPDSTMRRDHDHGEW
jgi:hypothetical protein